MNAPDRFLLPDVQASADLRRLAIQHVGVKGLRYPAVGSKYSGRGGDDYGKHGAHRRLGA